MWLRLRQICLVAHDIAAVTEQLEHVFDIAVCHIDPGVGKFGLENRLLPIGNQLLEVVAPITDNTAAGRYLDRRGGDGGYMVITQCDDAAVRRARVDTLGVRVAHALKYDDYDGMQLHPRDTGGTFLEIDQQLNDNAPDGAWHPAGPDWQAYRRTDCVSAISGAELQSPDPMNLAERWASIIESPVHTRSGRFEIELENAHLYFVSPGDERGEGLSTLYLKATDAAGAKGRAKARGLLAQDESIHICGTRFILE